MRLDILARHRQDKETKPWLKMVGNLPEDLSPKQRCQAIAEKLETLKEDDSTSLTYMQNPLKQEEYYVCVKTQSSYNNCTPRGKISNLSVYNNILNSTKYA